MADRESVMKVLAEVKRRREEAEALADRARSTIAQATVAPLDELDIDQLRAAADTFADEATKLRLLQQQTRDLQGLLV